MKYFATILITTLLLMPPEVVNAQQDLDRSDLEDFARGELVRTPSSTEVKGSPFFYDDWITGKVFINDRVESEKIPLKFDTHEQVVQFRRNGKTFAIGPNKLVGFVFYADPNNIIFKNGFESPDNNIDKQTLLRIIEEGESATFVAHHHTRLYEDAPSYGSANQIKEFRNRDTLYMIDGDGNFTEVKLRKRHITRALKDMADKVEQHANKNNLSFRNEDDVARMVNKYNEWKAEKSDS